MTERNLDTTYPKGPVAGQYLVGDPRVDACEAALDDLHRRLDRLRADAAPDPSGKLTERERETASPREEHREEMPEGAFLEPGERKYPVKVRCEGAWCYDRDLLLAAAREARMHGHEELAQEADRIRERDFREGGERKDADIVASVSTMPGQGNMRQDAEARTDPPESEAQRRFMRWAEEHPGEAGVSRKVSEEFNQSDPGGKLPERKDNSGPEDDGFYAGDHRGDHAVFGDKSGKPYCYHDSATDAMACARRRAMGDHH